MKTAPLLALLLATACLASAAPGLMIPLYSYPTDNGGAIWQAVQDAASNNPSISVIAIVNPDSGPGTTYDSTYNASVNTMVNAGVKCIGYVSTNYSAVPFATVTSNMDKYKTWYPGITGFFLDEMTNVGSQEVYYSNATKYAVSIGKPYTVGNAGTSTTQAYFNTVNNTVIYEKPGLPTAAALDLGFTPSGCTMMAYNVAASALNQTYIESIIQYSELVYITDDTLPNPYDVLPTYFSQLVTYLASGAPAVPPTAPSAPSASPLAPSSTPTSGTPSNVPSDDPTPPSAASSTTISITLLLGSLAVFMI